MTTTSISNETAAPATLPLQRILCGSLAGAFTKTCIAPLERIKIVLQTQGMVRTAGKLATNEYIGIGQTLTHMIRNEGLKSLWNGNGANVMRVIPNYGLRFMFNDRARDLFVSLSGKKQGEPLSRTQLFFAGALAGTCQISITYPMEVIFTRLALSGSKVYTGPKYNGIFDCLRSTLRNEGPRALYNGYLITLLSGTPYVALQMSIYEMLQRLIQEKLNVTDIGVVGKLACGSGAVIVAQTVTFPGDVIRKRMQSDGMGGSKKAYTGLIDAAKAIYKKEGWRAFFDGLKVNTWRCIPEGAIMFLTFDTLKKALDIAKYDRK